MTQSDHPFIQKLRRSLPLLVFCFCVFQPLLDIAGFWQDRLGTGNAATLTLRLLLLIGMTAVGFLLSDRKQYYAWTAMLLSGFTALHTFACMQVPGGYWQPLKDLVNLVRIYSLPVTLLCFVTFLRQNEKTYRSLLAGLTVNLAIILASQLLSTLTKTDPHTYHSDGVGVLGWFLWTNSQSAILSILVPVSVCWAMQRWKTAPVPVACVTAAAELALFLLAPRLSYACMLAVGFGLGLCVLLFSRVKRKQAAAMLLVTALFLAAYPLSPTHTRLQLVQQQAAASQQHLDEKDLPSAKKPGPGETLSEEDLQKYEKIYHSLGTVYSVVERFGLERTLQAYDYTLDASILSDARLRKITFCRLLMEDAGPLSRLFGLNLAEMFQFIPQGFLNESTGIWEDGYESLDVENDFHGIYFLTGLVGLCLMAALFLFVGIKALLFAVRYRRSEHMPELAAFSAAFLCALLHAVFTASVLRRNNASVYLAIVMAVILYLSDQKKKAETA